MVLILSLLKFLKGYLFGPKSPNRVSVGAVLTITFLRYALTQVDAAILLSTVATVRALCSMLS